MDRKQEKIFLLYGLRDAQKNYLLNSSYLREKDQDKNNPLYANAYNDEILDKHGLFDKDKQDLNIGLDFLETHAKDWKKKISSNYTLWDAYYEKTQEDNKFNYSNILKKFKEEGFDQNEEAKNMNLFIRSQLMKSGCKLFLELAKDLPNVEIYFLLDGLNLEQIVTKKYNSFTSSELRYAYRNRHELADKINFYQNGELVAAPWETNPTLWNRYKPKKEIKSIINSTKNSPSLYSQYKLELTKIDKQILETKSMRCLVKDKLDMIDSKKNKMKFLNKFIRLFSGQNKEIVQIKGINRELEKSLNQLFVERDRILSKKNELKKERLFDNLDLKILSTINLVGKSNDKSREKSVLPLR